MCHTSNAHLSVSETLNSKISKGEKFGEIDMNIPTFQILTSQKKFVNLKKNHSINYSTLVRLRSGNLAKMFHFTWSALACFIHIKRAGAPSALSRPGALRHLTPR